jgi:hypothetical protein
VLGDLDWPKDKLTHKMQAIRDERDKLFTDLDRLDADLKVAHHIIGTALTPADQAPAALPGHDR